MPAIITCQLESIVNSLVPSNNDLRSVCDTFEGELNQALQSSVTDSLRVYPTFVRRLPTGSEHGKYLALDLGGTNFRILLINLNGGRESSVINKTFAISQQLMHGSGHDLFDYIAQCLYNFAHERNIADEKLSLGFTFSFPCKQVGLKKAFLTNWTKGFRCADTVNQDVGEMLQRALGKYPLLKIEVAAIVNDTTGTLMSCAYMDSRCQVGVIIGTGVNLCYMESNKSVVKGGGPMIINTELGALGSRNKCLEFIQTQWDKQIDLDSINPGEQIFEKQCSGMYLGEIVRTVVYSNRLFGSNTDKFQDKYCFSSSHISSVELDDGLSTFHNTRSVLIEMGIENPSEDNCRSLFTICSAVSRRSAFLVAAAIATILRRIRKPFTVVGIDGSVFRHHPHYEKMMYNKIQELLHLFPDNKFKLMLSEDGSGRGAALVAAVSGNEHNERTYGICQHCRQADCFEIDVPQCILVKQ